LGSKRPNQSANLEPALRDKQNHEYPLLEQPHSYSDIGTRNCALLAIL